MTRDRATLTEAERDDLCDAIVDYTGNRAATAPARFDRHVVPAVERIIAERIAEARREAAAEALAPVDETLDGMAARPPYDLNDALRRLLTLRAALRDTP